MFLEIHDKNKNDVVIYSQNIFDQDENFRIIYKDAIQKKHQKIKFSDVCDFLNYPLPKNIIIYRLLTNYEAINAIDSKYGIQLYIDNKEELIYFDPIFALKDLSNLVKDYDLKSFRFKIQQIGVRTLSILNNRERFTEVYCYDLYAIEAQNQNDKIFADALFPEDIDFFNISELEIFENNSSIEEITNEEKIDEISQKLSEDVSSEERAFKKPTTKNISVQTANKFEQKELLKRVLGIDRVSNVDQSLIKIDKNENSEIDLQSRDEYSNLFKSTSKKNEVKERENDSIILKLT